MRYDLITKRVGDYSKKKSEVDEEDCLLNQDESHLNMVLQESLSLDNDLQQKLKAVYDEYTSERVRIDAVKEELKSEEKELSDAILSEMEKLSETQGKLKHVEKLKYGRDADKAKKRCEDYLAQLEGLLGQLSNSDEIGMNISDKREMQSDEPLFSRISGINDEKNNNINLQINTGQVQKAFVQGMSKILSMSSHRNVKDIYVKYADKLMVADSNYAGGAFYRYGDGVFMNEKEVSKGDLIHKPYQTAFHEFGHNIDYLMGNGTPISESWNNGQLYSAIQQDFTTIKNSMSDDELINQIREDMKNNNWSIMDMASVSDMLECLMGRSYPLGVGHGASYWVNPTRLPCKEFFAETLDGAAANENSYTMLQKYFPTAVSVVNDILNGGM